MNKIRTKLKARTRTLSLTRQTLRSADLGRIGGAGPSVRLDWGCSSYGIDLTDGDRLSHCDCA